MNIEKVNFIKKSFINFEGKSEKLLIYREQGESAFHFVFKCPKCGLDNEFSSDLISEKARENGKTKERYILGCQKCKQGYSVERLKPPRGKSK